jgi:glutamate--cysteine ligase
MVQKLTPLDADAYIRGVAFKTGPPARVGVELEWLVHDLTDPLQPVSPARVDAALAAVAAAGALPGGGSLTREPGGQLEVSSSPGTLISCIANTATDTAALSTTLAGHGLTLTGWGLEPFLEPKRVLEHPRYQAMEAFFDRGGPWGRWMMRATAGVQVNLDAGDDGDGVTGWRRRWRLAHRIGPVLVAAFANSPLWHGRPTGFRSSRQALWTRLDPGRSAPADEPRAPADPRRAWAHYALDAELLCVRRAEGEPWDAPAGLTLRSWLEGEPGLPPPTRADLDYHLTTLFPPVRPRGWIELRMIDAQQGGRWAMPLAVAATLLDDPRAAEAAWAATEPLCRGDGFVPDAGLWDRAARDALTVPELGKAALGCFAAAESALAGLSGAGALRAELAAFTERYVARGRCPADDYLDALRCGASLQPLEEAWR